MGARIGILTGGGDCPGLNAAIRGVVKVRMSKRDDVSGEVLAPTRGGVITHIHVDTPSGPAEASSPSLAVAPSAMSKTGPSPAISAAAPAPRAAKPNLGMWIALAIIAAAIATIVVTLAR